MTVYRSFALFSGLLLFVVLLVPPQAMAQEASTAKEPALNPVITQRVGFQSWLGARYYTYPCDIEGSFFKPNRSFLETTGSLHQLPCTLRDRQYRQDGDHGGGGGRPNPGSPTSNTYPDTRFNLADVLDDYRVSGAGRQAAEPRSNDGVAAPRVYREPLEPQFEKPAAGKKAAAYAARSTQRVTRLPVRTAPVVTKQIMEDRILEGQMRRAQRSSGSARGVSERSPRPPTPSSSVQRAAPSRPAAGRPRSSGSASTRSPSPAPASSSAKSGRRGSKQTGPQS